MKIRLVSISKDVVVLEFEYLDTDSYSKIISYDGWVCLSHPLIMAFAPCVCKDLALDLYKGDNKIKLLGEYIASILLNNDPEYFCCLDAIVPSEQKTDIKRKK